MQVDGFRDLVWQAQAGDRPAIDRLFALALPYVEGVLRNPARAVRPEESVSDRVQDVCLRVLNKLDQFRGAHLAPDDEQAWALFRGWVRQIIHSVDANARRDADGPKPPYEKVSLQTSDASDSTSHPGVSDPPAPGPTPSSMVRASERARRVLEALDKLPDPKHREIVRLRYFEGLSLKQIAVRMELSYDIVRDRYRVSMQRLRRELEGLQ
jgi:RNA polymerase sigma factor (sigma-70 family)